MCQVFRATVSAICYTVAIERAASEWDELTGPYNDLTRFVLAQHGRLPDVFGVAMSILVLVFTYSAVPFLGRPFHRASQAQRARWLSIWQRAPLDACRQFVRFHEGLSVFALYGRLDRVLEKKGIDAHRRTEAG